MGLGEPFEIVGENRWQKNKLPKAISEAVFCLNFKAGRLVKCTGEKTNTSFDCFDINKNNRIQVKGCSVSIDLTSFGPRSVWDELYFVHFFPNQMYDGCYNIYFIDNHLIYEHKVSKSETFLDQQRQGRRPRFSIMKDIVEPNQIEPVIKSKL